MNTTDSPSTGNASPAALGLEPALFGTFCGLSSAVGYTAANIALRAAAHLDPVWVSCIKAFPTLLLVGPWLFVRIARRQPLLPPRRVIGALLLAALIGQLIGNVAFQWSLGVIGIALAVPLNMGTMIVSGAIFGRLLLREPVTSRTAVSLTILVIAIFVLSLGAGDAFQAVVASTARFPPGAAVWWVAAGVLATCASGLAYSFLGIVIRYGVTGKASISMTMTTISVTGVVCLSTLSYARIGTAGMLATSGRDLAIMLVAGTFNALAFLALTKALQLSSVVYVNALNATQVMMAAFAGILFFAESQTTAMWVGVALTIVGLLSWQKAPRTQPLEEPSAIAPERRPVAATSEAE